jgi:hypothetical protein
MKSIYIAGPMRGYDKYNFPAFDDAAERFRSVGWNVINPADLDRIVGVHENTDPLPEGFLRGAMERDLKAICGCDAIALLPGWRKSSGVGVELALANLLQLEVINAITMHPMEESILEEAQRITRGDRQDDYGHPFDEHGMIAAHWGLHLGITITAEQVAELMVLMKLVRNKHRKKRDNAVDMAGYADCLHRITEERQRRLTNETCSSI